MKLSEATVHPPCPNPACDAKLSVRLFDLTDGVKVTCEACGAVTALHTKDDAGEPSPGPGAALQGLQRSLDAVGAVETPKRDDEDEDDPDQHSPTQ